MLSIPDPRDGSDSEGRQMVGREVILEGGYPTDWLLVDRDEGKRLRLRRRFGHPAGYSAGFWIDSRLVRQTRRPPPTAI